MADSNRQNTESIIEIIKQIDSGNVVLPDFQRDFVWDESKTYDLFDSLIKDIFIGSIIYGIPSFEITVREVDKRPRKVKGKKRASLKTYDYSQKEINEKVKTSQFRAVLDGQQRLTSIYRALRKIDSLWLIVKGEEEGVKESKDFRDASLEEVTFCFSGTEDKDRLSLNVGDVFEMMEKGLFEDEIKAYYFNELEYIKEMDLEVRKKHFARYLLIKRKIEDLFKAEKLVSYFLLDMSSDKFALFFERSNSLGVRLDFIDILVAKLSHGFKLRTEIEKLQSGTDYTVEREVLVRAIAYIISEEKNVDKGYILSSLTYEHFQENWENACKWYIDVLEFLQKNNFMITHSWIPHTNMIIPLMMFLAKLPSQQFSQMKQEQAEFIRFWYWGSIFSQRYTGGATNEVIIKDCKILSGVAQGKKVEDSKYFRTFKSAIERPEDLYLFNKKGSALYKGVLTFINYRAEGLVDWENNSKIIFTKKVDDHHIFPKAYLQAIAMEEDEIELADCVVNRTLIPKITNIKIGKKPPSEYMKEIYKTNTQFQDTLKNHLIPNEIMDGLYNEFFNDFIEERANHIFEEIRCCIIEQRSIIENMHYREERKTIGKNVNIFATYRNKTVHATFNRETQEIFMNSEKYSSVSSAADAAKKLLTGRENTSTDGWKFWKYKDGEEEKFIEDIRY